MSETKVITVDNMAKSGLGVVSSDVWYNADKKDASIYEGVKRGDSIQVEYHSAAGRNWVTKCEIVESSSTSTPTNTGSNYSKNNENTQRYINFHASRNAAIQFVSVALQGDVLPLPTKKADKYDAALALVDKLTVKFCNDAEIVGEGKMSVNDLLGGEEVGQFEEEENAE